MTEPGLYGEIQAARTPPKSHDTCTLVAHASGPVPAAVHAELARLEGRHADEPAASPDAAGLAPRPCDGGARSPLPPTARRERPALRGTLCALARMVAARYRGDVETADTCAVIRLAHGARVVLIIARDEEVFDEVGDVATHAAADTSPDFLTLASCAADLHREAARAINYAHSHGENPR